MAGMDHAPPPFFKRGPAPLALLTFYIAVSLAIFVFDLRFKSLELLRQSLALVVNPVQRVAQTPGSLVDFASHYLQGMHSLQQENRRAQACQADHGTGPATPGPTGSRKRAPAQAALGYRTRKGQRPGFADSVHRT